MHRHSGYNQGTSWDFGSPVIELKVVLHAITVSNVARVYCSLQHILEIARNLINLLEISMQHFRVLSSTFDCLAILRAQSMPRHFLYIGCL